MKVTTHPIEADEIEKSPNFDPSRIERPSRQDFVSVEVGAMFW